MPNLEYFMNPSRITRSLPGKVGGAVCVQYSSEGRRNIRYFSGRKHNDFSYTQRLKLVKHNLLH